MYLLWVHLGTLLCYIVMLNASECRIIYQIYMYLLLVCWCIDTEYIYALMSHGSPWWSGQTPMMINKRFKVEYPLLVKLLCSLHAISQGDHMVQECIAIQHAIGLNNIRSTKYKHSKSAVLLRASLYCWFTLDTEYHYQMHSFPNNRSPITRIQPVKILQ